MSKCLHPESKVKNSRPVGFKYSNGFTGYDDLPYPCLIVRRRECPGCKERFTTVEVPKDFMDSTNPRQIRKQLVDSMLEFVREKAFKDE